MNTGSGGTCVEEANTEPIAVREIGSFHIGGKMITLSGMSPRAAPIRSCSGMAAG